MILSFLIPVLCFFLVPKQEELNEINRIYTNVCIKQKKKKQESNGLEKIGVWLNQSWIAPTSSYYS